MTYNEVVDYLREVEPEHWLVQVCDYPFDDASNDLGDLTELLQTGSVTVMLPARATQAARKVIIALHAEEDTP